MINSNPIEINKSSLVSLKAEILRKQQEVNLSKLKEKSLKPVTKTKKKHAEAKQEMSKKFDDDEETEERLSRSRQMLESKTSLYNSLSKGASNLSERDKEISKRCLVQFEKKEPIIPPNSYASEESDEEYNSDDYESKNPDEEWVEYVDFLGRTRKCLRKDLEYMKRKDSDLCSSLDSNSSGNKNTEESSKFVKPVDTNTENSNDDTVEKQEEEIKELSEDNELLSSDMRRELLRREWEAQEEQLLNKRNIHYQDVLFNEARNHGVGYYAFSKDEEERAKQQENLKKLREETAQQQKATSELKTLREKQLAARLKAARNRKRARMGLPPEEDEPEIVPKVPDLEDEKVKLREVAKEAEEKFKQDERSRIVRPWDIGKAILKKHYECSQEEWTQKQREQRNKDFAPPPSYSNSFKRPTPIEEEEIYENKKLFFTSKKTKPTQQSFNYNYDDKNTAGSSYDDRNQRYSSTSDSRSIEESVMAGLKYLREQSEKRTMEEDE